MGPAATYLGRPSPAKAQVALLLMALSLLALASLQAAEGDRKIKTMGTGKASGTPVLAQWFTVEPSTDPTIIPTRTYGEFSIDVIKRYMRIYFPRNYEAVLEFEHFFMAQVDMAFLSPQQQRWLYDAFTDHQKGGVNTRSIMSAHTWYHTPWRDSIVSNAFPNDVSAVMAEIDAASGPLVIRDDEDLPAIMKDFKRGIEPMFPDYGGLNTVPRPGSVILSYTKNNVGQGYPEPGKIAHVFYWKWNRSITFTFRDMVGDSFWWSPSTNANPYSMDILANIIWFSVGRELPEDPLKVHDLRQRFFDFTVRRRLLLSLLEFTEKFGANPAKEYLRLGEIDVLHQEGREHYLDMDFDSAFDSMGAALEELELLDDEVMRLKDKSLFWIYLVEWLVTTGVLLLSGTLVWSLMVRRALYREVKATRWGESTDVRRRTGRG